MISIILYSKAMSFTAQPHDPSPTLTGTGGAFRFFVRGGGTTGGRSDTTVERLEWALEVLDTSCRDRGRDRGWGADWPTPSMGWGRRGWARGGSRNSSEREGLTLRSPALPEDKLLSPALWGEEISADSALSEQGIGEDFCWRCGLNSTENRLSLY